MKYTKHSFHIAVLSSLLLVGFVVLSNIDRTTQNNINDVTGYLITLFFVSLILGFVFAMLSLRESYHWKKYIGLGINVFYFILFILALIGNLQDLSQWFG
ncbi:hypothetical protein [Nonlabens xiamenensis]|uniref:hypothetical protein n=1 Tax=Nonlabens xiamenensis TaxID=2341043 RepID=UPI000F60A1B9|nr:hypothetical protein [Nonlabens xiamenensis]